MSDLQKHLDRLLTYFPRWSKQPLSWSRILIVEEVDMERGDFIRIPRAALATPEEYAVRFDKHLDAGHSWINMNAAGIVDDILLIVIELPGYFNFVPRDKVSINFSSPTKKDGEPQWDATDLIMIEN